MDNYISMDVGTRTRFEDPECFTALSKNSISFRLGNASENLCSSGQIFAEWYLASRLRYVQPHTNDQGAFGAAP